ncbi:CBN-OCT-2 protein, partial [Aphelenchoides avenae]
MISAHQVPHAMFNLSVVYFTYQPDHWCKIPSFSKEYIEDPKNDIGPGWTWEKALDSGIAFPRVRNQQRKGKIWHDQCAFYPIGDRQFRKYLQMNFTEAQKLAQENKPNTIERCREWEYDRTVMKDSVVIQWHRVCDDNWSRAHVHLSYSLGYLVGCIIGGFISDRYGRKPAIYGFSILSTIFGFLLPFSREFEVFLVVRFLLAVCNEAADLAAYVMCMEITGVKYRSIVGSLLQAPWACGYAFLALVAYITKSWVAIQMITTVLHFFALFLIHYLPESPRWLIVMNKVDEAEKIIRKACHFNKSSLPSDLELVRHAELKRWVKSKERPHFIHTFQEGAMGFRTLIILTVWIATALVYYGIVIALSDQSSPGRSMFVGNFFLNNAIAGAIELPTLMGCVLLMQYGRKRSQVVTLIGAGTLIFIAIIASLKEEMTVSPCPDLTAGKTSFLVLTDIHARREGVHPGRLQHSVHIHLRALPDRHSQYRRGDVLDGCSNRRRRFGLHRYSLRRHAAGGPDGDLLHLLLLCGSTDLLSSRDPRPPSTRHDE